MLPIAGETFGFFVSVWYDNRNSGRFNNIKTTEKYKETSIAMKIVIMKNGPFVVEKDVPVKEVDSLADKDGGVSDYEVQNDISDPSTEKYLCRCGHSKNKPFCDGQHIKIGFDGAETNNRKKFLEKAALYRGKVYDALVSEDLCAVGRFCDVGIGMGEALGSSAESDVKNVIHAGCGCPGGRIVLVDKNTGQTIEPELEKEIFLINDVPEAHLGPIYVRGGIQVIGADGFEYEIRNRMTLCRCGESSNMPFCDASHLNCEHMRV